MYVLKKRLPLYHIPSTVMAGTAAAMAVAKKCSVRAVETEALREELKRNKVYLG
jgi:hypothetical protein